jgi:hypothetical protein
VEHQRDWEGPRFEHWMGVVTNAKEFDNRDVAMDLRRLVFAVQSRANPDLPKTRNEVLEDMARVDAAYAAGHIIDKTHDALMNEAQQRLSKTQDRQKDYEGRQHAQVEQMLKGVTTSVSIFNFDGTSQRIYDTALEDLTMNSSYIGRGNVNPLDWWRKRAAFYIGQMGQQASAREQALSNQLRLGTGQKFALTGDDRADRLALEQQRSTFASEADYKDMVRRMKDIYDLRDAIKQNQARGKEVPTLTELGTQGMPSPPAPQPAPAGGKKLGR